MHRALTAPATRHLNQQADCCWQLLTDSFDVLRSADALASVSGADQKARPGAGSSTCE